MDGKPVKAEKKIGRPPRARTCYICGRDYMLHSFKIHEPQCLKLFEDRERQKPLKERKPTPVDPLTQMMARAPEKFSGGVNLEGNVKHLEELNKASAATWSEDALEKCQHCGRTFAGGALVKHQKSCTRHAPAKSVGGTTTKSGSRGGVAAARTNVRKPAPKFDVKIAKSVTVHFSAPAKKVDAPAWKTKSEDFRSAIRRARAVSKAEAKVKESGGHIDDYLPEDFNEQLALDHARATADYVECPTCSRTFNPQVAERHIPACAQTTARATRLLKGSGTGIGCIGSTRQSRSGGGEGGGDTTYRVYPKTTSQIGRPTFTDDAGVDVVPMSPSVASSRRRGKTDGFAVTAGADAQGALVRARIAKQKEKTKTAPMDNFLGRNQGLGYGAPSSSSSIAAGRSRTGSGVGVGATNKVITGGSSALKRSIIEGTTTTTTTGMATSAGNDLNALMRRKLKLRP